MDYSYKDLIQGYHSLGVSHGRVIYVTSDLWQLQKFSIPGKRALLDAHLEALKELLGPEGTIVVPTASMNLCNTDNVFDLQETPSFQRGAFSEHLRRQTDAKRSFHPFISYTALGAQANEITSAVTRHAFGPETPEARMIDMDALAISIGLHPRLTCSTIHNVEQIMGVPYRYTKEFLHPVRRNGDIQTEAFYMFVCYREIDIKRDGNKKLFEGIENDIQLNNTTIGKGIIYSYSLKQFQKCAIAQVAREPYIWCQSPPLLRPYRD